MSEEVKAIKFPIIDIENIKITYQNTLVYLLTYFRNIIFHTQMQTSQSLIVIRVEKRKPNKAF